MVERIGNPSCTDSLSMASEDGMRTRRQFRVGLLKWCLSLLTPILLGIATSLITPGGPAFASITLTLQPHAEGPCVDKTKRYVDCGNGTVTDTLTGLIWLKEANCFSSMDWEAAKKAAAGLRKGECMLTDGSSPGDWRLPTRAEWEATMKNALELQCTGPTLTNDAGTGCIAAGPSSFTGVESDYYWSSTTMEGSAHAWFGDLDHGHLLNGNLIDTLLVWPVRGGEH